ncbi:uncharacterized protein EDB91DRAFT_21901 [Suillus paluster]|uniref:uncharacterized protein n=1 Tax=Suillus paluster TaxID=48578 RepID=UPI001B86CA19|nr:uncharacterized protein EDB91DRAFT_21901 [Suillus paluster]KAG1756536.1 hypothetical protein EDB91DRAFT_21901 [Suillus paluster]
MSMEPSASSSLPDCFLEAPAYNLLAVSAHQRAESINTVGLNISRPQAPRPILAMQGNFLQDFRHIFDDPSPPLPLRTCNNSRFEPYYIGRPNEHHGTFLCRWDNEGTLCGHEVRATSRDVFAHLRENHHIGKEPRCLWATPHGRCGKQLRIPSFGRHVMTHVGIRIKCSVCGATMARDDIAARHRQQHPNCSQADFETIPGCNTQVPF